MGKPRASSVLLRIRRSGSFGRGLSLWRNLKDIQGSLSGVDRRSAFPSRPDGDELYRLKRHCQGKIEIIRNEIDFVIDQQLLLWKVPVTF